MATPVGPGRTLTEAEFNQVKAQVLADAPPNLTEAEFNRYIGPAMAQALTLAEAQPEGSAIGRFTSNVGAQVNPVTIASGLYNAVRHPIDTATHIVQAQVAEAGKAKEALQQGRYSEAVGHATASALPLIGPAAAAAGEQIGTGDVAGGLGTGTGLLLSQLGIPRAVSAVRSLPIVPKVAAATPAMGEAVAFGLREGIPVDVATATGNRFLRGTQRLAEESMLGSLVAEPVRAAQAEGLTQTGGRLAARTAPTPTTPELAADAVRGAVRGQAAAYQQAADTGYATLRALETQRGPLAVDLAPTKAALQPTYAALQREAQLVPLMGDKARALTTLDRLMQAPDQAPLSVADSALGDVKAVARVDDAFRRTVGQGIAARTVANLEAAVRSTAQQAGPDVLQALMEGRAGTINKYKTIAVLNRLEGTTGKAGTVENVEPVAVFRRLTANQDTRAKLVNDLARIDPDAVRQVGRAWLEDALGKATAEGGFGRAQGLFADWQRLGPQTKQALFGDPAHIRDLDNFFLLAKKMAENPNPSGTALTLFKGGELAALVSDPVRGAAYSLTAPVIAKALLSPTTTRLLLQGLTLPVGAKAARAAWAARLGPLLAPLEAAPAAATAQARPPD